MSENAVPPKDAPTALATTPETRPALALVPPATEEPAAVAEAPQEESKSPRKLMHPGTADKILDACDAEFQQAEKQNELLEAKSRAWIGFVLAFFVGMLTVGFTSFEKLSEDSAQRFAASVLLLIALVFEAAAFLHLLRAQFVAGHAGRPEGKHLIENGEDATADTIARSVARGLADAALVNVELNRAKARLIRFGSWAAFGGFAFFFAALLLILEHRLFSE